LSQNSSCPTCNDVHHTLRRQGSGPLQLVMWRLDRALADSTSRQRGARSACNMHERSEWQGASASLPPYDFIGVVVIQQGDSTTMYMGCQWDGDTCSYGAEASREAVRWVSILDFKQVWSFVLSHVRLAPLIRRGTHNLKNP